MARKDPTVHDLRAWIDEDLSACRFNFADSAARGDGGRAGFWAKRAGYLEASLEVIEWFTEETSRAMK